MFGSDDGSTRDISTARVLQNIEWKYRRVIEIAGHGIHEDICWWVIDNRWFTYWFYLFINRFDAEYWQKAGV